ncbi:MAG: heavy-metal-associated domain-containing protein [Pyrinomonadaceae bacterium MAG19_C2-C3]|nr:heavy-metal-associated domain-containing protein [Pyrinomonadaceae bacterium MAG19_C2-C3]
MKTKFNLSGMHCESCALDIQETLAETAGVNRADVSYADKQAIVDYDETIVQDTTLIKKIQDLDYEVTVSESGQ